jgi:hypothetical protein
MTCSAEQLPVGGYGLSVIRAEEGGSIGAVDIGVEKDHPSLKERGIWRGRVPKLRRRLWK